MRLLKIDSHGELLLTRDVTPPAPYAILSHTWSTDDDEVTFDDIENKMGKNKAGYVKLRFCAKQAKTDGLDYCWVDSCCINKANLSELSKAITSMFRWYQDAAKCYVYLSDVSAGDSNELAARHTWEADFKTSRWFTRGWTLQELLAPASVEFYSVEDQLLGTKQTLERLIHEITTIPIAALRGTPLSTFTIDERLRWTEGRNTKEAEDQAYCLLGIFGVFMPLIYGEGQNAYARLREEIKKGADCTRSSIHTHWMVSRAPNPLFTGREDILPDLISIISDALVNPPFQDQCRIVVTGMGGQGKSEVCLQLAHRFRQKFWGVFWIDVSSKTLAERSLLHLAHTLSVTAETWEEACLGIANLKHPWLLVLDNADNPNLNYQPYIPNSPLGVVMMTSRNEECQQYATKDPTNLEALSPNAAQNLLLKAAHVPASQQDAHAEDAARVAKILQSHPLALVQAGAYISRGHCRLNQYPGVYERQRRRLLEFRPTQVQSRYQDVYATFEASTDALKQSMAQAASDALELLPLLAVCGPNQLPLAVFQAGWESARKVSPYAAEDAEDHEVKLLTPWHVSRMPAFLNTSSETWDSFRLVEAVQLLKAFALVSTEGIDESMTVSMHPLVHAWARDRQQAGEKHAGWLSMGCVIAFAYKSAESCALDRQLQAHVESVVEWELGIMFERELPLFVARVLVNCGSWLYHMHSDGKLAVLIERLLGHLRLDATVVVPTWLGLFKLAARNLADRHKSQQAIGLLKQISLLQERSLAVDDPDRLTWQHNLAEAYRKNGQMKDAVAVLEPVVQIRTKSLAVHHIDLLKSQHRLARAYLANRQIPEAIALSEEVVQIRTQSLGARHSSRLAAQHVLAGAYRANGQVKEAAVLLEEVVQIEAQLLKADDPSRLESQHELAGCYYANEQVKEAVLLLQKVVHIEAESLPADHPSRLVSQHNLATYLWELGERERAHALMKHIVTIQKQSLDERHHDRQSSERWLEHMEKRMNE